MEKPSSTVADKLYRRLIAFDATRKRVDDLYRTKSVSQKFASHVYEAVYINSFTAFETFLEELFLGLLVSGSGLKSSQRVSPRIAVKSPSIARKVVFGGKSYLDWLPYERTLERAKIFFTKGRPFTDVSGHEKVRLKNAQIVRNAIAHNSRHSAAKFKEKVVAGLYLPPRQRTPAGYLQSLITAKPRQTRYEEFAAFLLRFARQLAR